MNIHKIKAKHNYNNFEPKKKSSIYIYIYLARTPGIGQGLGRILSCGACKPEQT